MGVDLGERMRQADVDHVQMCKIQVGILLVEGNGRVAAIARW